MTKVMRIAAAVAIDARGHVLLVRKRGTMAFMLPGGKLEPGESAETAMQRELREEIGCGVALSRWLGRFSALAANEPGWRVDADLFHVELADAPVPATEIDALVWLDPSQPDDIVLAPLVVANALPLATTILARLALNQHRPAPALTLI